MKTQTQTAAIDWSNLNVLRRIGSLQLLHGEACLLTEDEIGEINTQVREALRALEPVIDLCQTARDRYSEQNHK